MVIFDSLNLLIKVLREYFKNKEIRQKIENTAEYKALFDQH